MGFYLLNGVNQMYRTKEMIFKNNSSDALLKIQYDLVWFVKNVIGFDIDKFHEEQLNLLWKNRYVCIVSPRGHLKTTLFSVCYPIWLLYTKKDIRIALVSAGLQQAKDTLEIIKKIITENELLSELIPTDRSDSWSKMELTTRNGNSLKIKPFTSRIRGTHVDYFICDDILRDEDITQVEAKRLFWNVISPCINTRKGQLIVVGTPMKADDLLAELRDKKGWAWKRYQAVEMDDNGNWISPLWGKRFTLDELKQIQDNMGELEFQREYLCNPLSGGDSIFKEELIRNQIHNEPEINAPRKNCMYYLGVDVALMKGKSADFTVLSVVETNEFGICNLVKLERFKGQSQHYILKRVKELHQVFNFRKIVIEDRGLSQSLVSDAKIDDEIKYVVEGFVTTKERKADIIMKLQSGFMKKILFILNHPVLIRELMAFGIHKDRRGVETWKGLGTHDDTVMSLAFAYDAATYGKRGKAYFKVIG